MGVASVFVGGVFADFADAVFVGVGVGCATDVVAVWEEGFEELGFGVQG